MDGTECREGQGRLRAGQLFGQVFGPQASDSDSDEHLNNILLQLSYSTGPEC